ncbi:Uncharacterized protein GQ600_14991 [Phytophthora cactorum]|nr:Uncharacterized protein GQ600_14991 [Phytophthora cactorum]
MSPLTSQPLGISLPPRDTNAISVSMPDWEHIVGYEEGRPEVLDAMACGYPRFFRHPLVVALQTATQNQIFSEDDASQWEVMTVPTSDVAERLRHFLLASNSDSVKSDEVSVHVVKNAVHAVRFPRRISHTAKQFWQHSGEIVASRHAEKLLQVLKSDGEVKTPAVAGTDSHLALRQRVAELYLPSSDATKVALYPTGMGAIFSTVRLLQKLRGKDYKSILVGFPYVDTLKILSRKEWCAQGVHFFPSCGEEDMKQIEGIVTKEKILGIWTEFPNLVATSLSKIFSGTCNVMGGSVVLNPASPKFKELEAIFDPEGDSFIVEDDAEALLEQSRDLNERLAKTNATTAEIIQRLQKHPLVKVVFYPTLGDAKNLYDPFLNPSDDKEKPRYGPLFSVVLHGGLEPAKAFYNAMAVAKGPSLGTNFTLSCPYALLAHFGELDFVESCGVDRNLIRISIGQEDPEVIWADLEQAFAAASAVISASKRKMWSVLSATWKLSDDIARRVADLRVLRADKKLRLSLFERELPADGVSQSFQDQVLNELRKLKESQRMEFEALERLQREKDEAERKARRLEQKLREQQRQLSRNEEKSMRCSEIRKQKTQPEIILREDSDEENNGKIYSRSNSDTGDACDKDGSEEEENLELSEWDDATKSPPPYYVTVASPWYDTKLLNWIRTRASNQPAFTHVDVTMQAQFRMASMDWRRITTTRAELGTASSSEPTKLLDRRSRSRSKLDMSSSSRSRSLSRSRSNSAMSSHVHRLSQSRSRSPSATRTHRSTRDSQELRRSCAFFEEKARTHAEAEKLAKEAAERLQRARHAAPPQKLLEREALAQQRKSQQQKMLKQEWTSRQNRVKARDVPLTTYLSAGDAEEAEQKRKERIRQRAEEMMQSAELPPRMAVASKSSVSDADAGSEGERVTVKLKKKLRAAAEEEARRQRHRPKPVPNFDQLHSKWETALKKRKELARRNQDEEEVNEDAEASSKKSAEFFTSRAAKLAELQEKKEARKQRLRAKEEAIQQHARRAQEKLLARTRASLVTDAGSQRKPTKSETLRVQKLMAEAARQEKERQREEREAGARERRREEAARRVRAQVKRSETVRRDNYSGDFVDLKDLDVVAKEKAREQRQQFKEAIARNKEKLLAATAARPSLMERFSTTVKRETHRRAALEAVVKTVFQKDLSTLKGVLTDDEQELASAMIAADDNDENSETS